MTLTSAIRNRLLAIATAAQTAAEALDGLEGGQRRAARTLR
jgi:hypothetical protein